MAARAKTPSPTPKNTLSALDDTPRSHRTTGGSRGQATIRPEIAHENRNEIVTCSLDEFVSHYLPFVPTKGHIEGCKTALQKVVSEPRKGETPSANGTGETILKVVASKASHARGEQVRTEPASESRGERAAQGPDSPPTTTPNQEYQWARFSVQPSAMKYHEPEVFDSLREIADVIARQKLSEPQQNATKDASWRYHSSPGVTIAGEKDGSTHKIDGCFYDFIPPSGNLSISDVTVVAEYKKSKGNADVVQNRCQIVADANHLLNEDPRRQFTYGITIEDNEMSLWYFSRAHSAKSEPFDFMKDIDTTIQVIIAFMFATEEALGFDQNVRRINPPSEDREKLISYVYKLDGDDGQGRKCTRFYHTQSSILDLRRLCITGRATRVWKAIQVQSFDNRTPVTNASPVVLRDVWLDQGAKTEREIQKELYEHIEAFGQLLGDKDPPAYFESLYEPIKSDIRASLFVDHNSSSPQGVRKLYQKYFLTILFDSVGQECKEVASEYRIDPLLLCLDEAQVAENKKRPSLTPGADPTRNREIDAHVMDDKHVPNTTNLPPRHYTPKRPYRLIYQEICKDLDDPTLKSAADVFTGLRDCLTALALMFCAGWVHRDISCGNVLLWHDPEHGVQGKLGDLEYAKQFPSEGGSGDPKTGTAYFMAVEILLGTYLPLIQPDISSQNMSKEERRAMLKQAEDEPLSVRHSFVHDLESLWWLALWVVAFRTGNALIKEKFSQYFSSSTNGATKLARQGLLTRRTLFRNAARESFPRAQETLYDGFNSARDGLFQTQARFAADAKLRQEKSAYLQCFELMRDLFDTSLPPDMALVVDTKVPRYNEVVVRRVKRQDPGNEPEERESKRLRA